MAHIGPALIPAENVDQLLIARACLETLIGLVRLTFDVGDKVTGEAAPVSFRVAVDIGYARGDIGGQGCFHPACLATVKMQRATAVMPLYIDGTCIAVKGDIIILEARLQPAMFEQGRDRPSC